MKSFIISITVLAMGMPIWAGVGSPTPVRAVSAEAILVGQKPCATLFQEAAKAAAKDLGKFGVTCNAFAPGSILTEMGESMPEQFRQAAIDESAVKRAGLPEDIAWLVAFLASACGRHITGEVIKVDGGQYI